MCRDLFPVTYCRMIRYIQFCSAFRMTLFIFCLLVIYFEFSNGLVVEDLSKKESDFSFNLTHVLLQAVLFCGTEIVCNKALLNSVNIPININRKSWCPECSCSVDCLIDKPGVCCPEIFFKQGFLECKALNVLPFKNEALYPTISTCPPSSSLQMRKLCQRSQSDVERMQNPPVTGKISHLTYENKFCAICNNESKYESWNLEWKCNKTVDINFISSLEKLVKIGINNECGILFHHSLFSKINCSSNEKIANCNFTGNWKTYDIQIERACLSAYNVSFGAFKNVFCAICNPPDSAIEQWIDECKHSNEFQDACLNQQDLEASFPHKNYFCFACNRNTSDFLDDVDLLKNENSYNTQKQFEIVLEFQYTLENLLIYLNKFSLKTANFTTSPQNIFNVSSLINNVTDGNMIYLKKNRYGCLQKGIYGDGYGTVPIEFQSSEIHAVNITNLVRYSFALTQNGACKPELLPNYTLPLQKACSCSFGCTSQCCDDHAFMQSWICINHLYPGLQTENNTEREYLVMDGCPFRNDYRSLCLDKIESHFYHRIPVRVSSGYFESYVNLFCYLCTKIGETISQKNTIDLLKGLRPWTLNATCPKYLNYRHVSSLHELINYLHQSSCVIAFVPPKGSMKCKKELCNVDIASCNVTGNWKTFDKDIYIACEHTDVLTFMPIELDYTYYKNKFCLICNPAETDDSSFSKTDSCELHEEPSLIKACEQFPPSPVCKNYKNLFCQECNEYEVEKCSQYYAYYTPEAYYTPKTPGRIVDLTVKTEPVQFPFDVSDDFRDHYYVNDTHCSTQQIYDITQVCLSLLNFNNHIVNLTQILKYNRID